ncbi:hypothetical protein V6B08_19795 [Ferrovibrio sp. MS7]|uniref:hypothetical protein n=1 Tax=Ferrovibrio plantarum TaxID=3119164 RepID=UPI003136E117
MSRYTIKGNVNIEVMLPKWLTMNEGIVRQALDLPEYKERNVDCAFIRKPYCDDPMYFYHPATRPGYLQYVIVGALVPVTALIALMVISWVLSGFSRRF